MEESYLAPAPQSKRPGRGSLCCPMRAVTAAVPAGVAAVQGAGQEATVAGAVLGAGGWAQEAGGAVYGGRAPRRCCWPPFHTSP